jgi:hexosaminidase
MNVAMKTQVLPLLAAALLSLAGAARADGPDLIPMPARIEPGQGGFTVADGAVIAAPVGDAQAMFAAKEAARLAARQRGLKLRVRAGGGAGAVTLRLDPTLSVGREGYRLVVTPAGVVISGQDEAGLFYGAMTLAQLLSPADSFKAPMGAPVRLDAMAIEDQPRFAWRGVSLDVARHFQPVSSIKALLDHLAAQKLNTFHWHLTDDQGWRIEIKRYPLLTRIGAWRTPPSVGANDGHAARYGGFYTQAQIREIVAYAAARHITVVPEIDMPGHAQALVAAYPRIGVTGARPAVAVDWGVNPYLLNTDPHSLTFIHNVLDEVMALFPSTFIHVGGDEALKDQWKASPQIQARMKGLGIKTEDGLQSWFVENLGQYLQAHGRRLIGWDEILDGGLPPSASIMSWRGAEGAVIAAKAGHDVVLAPTTIYLDNQQSHRDDEPQGRIGDSPLAAAYAVDVSPQGIDPAQMHHVLGLEGSLWTEYLPAPWHVNHALYPRLAAIAEAAWSPQAQRDFPSFLRRLPAQITRYARTAIDSADQAFAPDFDIAGGPNAALEAGQATLALSDQVKFGDIRFTVDSAPPTADSPIYAAPFKAPLGALIQARTYTADGQPLSAPRQFSLAPEALLTRDSAQLEACPDGAMGLRVPLSPDVTTTAPVFDVNLFDSCWIYPKARLDGVARIEVAAARLPRNYGLAHDIDKVVSHPASTPFGELVIRAGSCAGPVLASLSLPDPKAGGDVHLPLGAAIKAQTGEQDLCMMFTAPIDGPLYAINTVQLVRTGDAR